MGQPLVTIICLCHNQERLVGESLLSVYQQTYPAIELIVIDNHSSDASVEKIEAVREIIPQLTLLQHSQQLTTGAACNQAMTQAKGTYVIHLNAATLLVPDRIAKQVAAFETLDNRFGVVFSNARYIDENATPFGLWQELNQPGHQAFRNASNVYRALFDHTFLCSPTLMIRRSVWEESKGYDETLMYPEFDFQVRSTKKYNYYYQDEVLTQVIQPVASPRLHITQIQLETALHICHRAQKQNSFDLENQALAAYVRQCMRQALFTDHYTLVHEFVRILEKITELTRTDQLWISLAKTKVPFSLLHRPYMRLKSPKTVV